MKILINIVLALTVMFVGLTSCVDSIIDDKDGNTILSNGDIMLSMNAFIPAPCRIETRAIDPDGLRVNNLWLFCFNEYGSYIGRSEAEVSALDDSNHFGFSVSIPSSTRIIHFLSNIYLDEISVSPGMNETTLIPSLVSASGRMVYWGRKSFESQDELENFKNGTVELYRNQAQVNWKIDNTNSVNNLQVFGYAICNCKAWGTVAPFNQTSQGNPFGFTLKNPFVTMPGEEYNIMSTDPTQVSVIGNEEDGDPRYIFETPNTLDEPVYAIMKIGAEEESAQYYKIMFVDDNKDQLPIYRNYQYIINIKGLPNQMGYTSFDQAKKGVAANNAWVSIDPVIPEMSDGTNTLNILNGTTQIFNTGGEQTIGFTYTGAEADVKVSWLENDGNISSLVPEITKTDENNGYEIKMQLAQPDDKPVKGTLLLRAGVFTRQIKVYLMKPFEFKPVWVSTGVPMVKGEQMSMTFVIPDSYPEELFPITCKIATNKMNANSELGMQLPIISEKCQYSIVDESGNNYERTTNWGYKFIYTANRPGIQKIFFKLNVTEGNDPTGTVEGCTEENGHTHVFLEADNFLDEEKLVIFQRSNNNRRIILDGAESNNSGYLSHNLFPTINQPVSIKFFLKDGESNSSPSEGTVMRIATTSLKPDFKNYPSEKDLYLDGGNPAVNGIVTYYRIKPTAYEYELHFLTKTPNVSDLVRLSIDGEAGNENADDWYKSAAIELKANPGHFTFDFNIIDDDPDIDNVKYGLGQPADMHFSIPLEAVERTSVRFFIRTNNLVLNDEDPNKNYLKKVDGGYIFTVEQGYKLENRGTLKFLTNRIASAETVTISTVDDSEALFASASASFTNEPITGTLKLEGYNVPVLSTTSFITLERKNGTRVGDFNIQSVDADGIATYKLTIRPEYDFTMDETLVIYFINDGTTYNANTTFNALVDHESDSQVPLIILKE